MEEELGQFPEPPDEQMAIRSDILNSVILQQQKRIAELEHKSRLSQAEMQRLKRSLRSPKRAMSTKPSHEGRRSKSSSSEQPRYWTQEEHNRFLVAREKLGAKNYAAISEYVSSRTAKQVRTHAQKFEMRMARDTGQSPLRMSRGPADEAEPLTIEDFAESPSSSINLTSADPSLEVVPLNSDMTGPLDYFDVDPAPVEVDWAMEDNWLTRSESLVLDDLDSPKTVLEE